MNTSGRHRICTTLLLGSLLIAPSQVFSEPPLSEDQAELKQALNAIYDDAMSANVEGLTTSHLISSKFTKFGPRNFSRQTSASFLSFSDNYMRIRQNANTTDRRLVGFKSVSLYNFGLTLHIGEIWTLNFRFYANKQRSQV
jgi:hypothetical protein